jgi:hypothetical protein
MLCEICAKEAATGFKVSMMMLDEGQSSPTNLPAPTLQGKPICAKCAHDASHSYRLAEGHIPCPVVDSENKVIIWGTYPNIDWS